VTPASGALPSCALAMPLTVALRVSGRTSICMLPASLTWPATRVRLRETVL